MTKAQGNFLTQHTLEPDSHSSEVRHAQVMTLIGSTLVNTPTQTMYESNYYDRSRDMHKGTFGFQTSQVYNNMHQEREILVVVAVVVVVVVVVIVVGVVVAVVLNILLTPFAVVGVVVFCSTNDKYSYQDPRRESVHAMPS